MHYFFYPDGKYKVRNYLSVCSQVPQYLFPFTLLGKGKYIKSQIVKAWRHDWLIAAGAYLSFCNMKRLGVFLLPLDGMLASPFQVAPPQFVRFPKQLTGNHLFLWMETLWELTILPKNITQCPRPELELGALASESSALTMRPPRLPERKKYKVT